MIVRDPGTAAHPACCAAIALLLFVSGCQMGPGAMKAGHQQYSAVLRQILNEQMLLNLVRLRYTDAPMFLQITSRGADRRGHRLRARCGSGVDLFH